jgi:hypothetical protein
MVYESSDELVWFGLVWFSCTRTGRCETEMRIINVTIYYCCIFFFI